MIKLILLFSVMFLTACVPDNYVRNPNDIYYFEAIQSQNNRVWSDYQNQINYNYNLRQQHNNEYQLLMIQQSIDRLSW